MNAKILVVDDEENICFAMKALLSKEGYHVDVAYDFDAAADKIDRRAFDLVFADIRLKGKSGTDLLRLIRKKHYNMPVVMITGVPTIESASEAVRSGAYDYLPKPVLKDQLLRVTRTALAHKHLADEKEQYRSNIEAIFKSVKDAIITVSNDLTILEVNEAAKQICGIGKGVKGQEFKSLMKCCGGQCTDILKDAIAARKHISQEFVNCRNNLGQHKVISLSACPLIDQEDRLSGGVLVVRDETRLASLEKNLTERSGLHRLVGKSKGIQEVYAMIDNLCDLKSTVLIIGDSGTGKELVAEAIHYCGALKDEPLVKVNCAALADNLLASELFGHVKGAFTGALKDKPGRLEIADGGTIFFDEIGDLSPRMQVALLRVLQDQEFERVGDNKTLKVDVRVIAATNKDLQLEVEQGRIRHDLYYRLKVIQLDLPPLNKRREDIPLLVEHFVGMFNKQFNKRIAGISDEVLTIFMRHDWPGNVREMKHALEHAFILCKSNRIVPGHLPPELVQAKEKPFDGREEDIILNALNTCRWNKTRAAEMLGMSRQHLYRKIKAYRLLK